MQSADEPEDPREIAAKHAPWARRIAVALALVYGMVHVRDDLVGIALLALSRASESFDPTRGRSFEVFAYKRVAGEVLDEIGKELRHLAFLRAPMLEASIDAGGMKDSEETLETLIAQVDAILASAMDAAYLGCMGKDHRASDEAKLIEHEAYERLHQAIERLPPEEHRLVDLRYFQGLEWKQVALALDLPERTAKNHDLRIRVRMRREMSS